MNNSNSNEHADGNASYPSDTPEQTQIDDGTRLISADVSCLNCKHRNVCAVYRGIAPMLENWRGGKDGVPPINLDDLAVICDEYMPEEQ